MFFVLKTLTAYRTVRSVSLHLARAASTGENRMDLIRTFQSIPPNDTAEGVPQPRTQTWRKSVAHRPQGAGRVVEREDEWEQIQRALAGDGDALSTLLARHRIRLYRAAF